MFCLYFPRLYIAAAGGHPGLHVMRKDHYKRRSACLNKLSVIFGHLPLHQTKARVHETVAKN